VTAGQRLSIERMVELGRVSRSGFYRFDENARPDRDMDLRDAIQRIALEWPSYGRPRITAELRRRAVSADVANRKESGLRLKSAT